MEEDLGFEMIAVQARQPQGKSQAGRTPKGSSAREGTSRAAGRTARPGRRARVRWQGFGNRHRTCQGPSGTALSASFPCSAQILTITMNYF